MFITYYPKYVTSATNRCHCTPDHYGVHCAETTNSCSSGSSREMCGHGTCVDQTSGYTCICDQGWETDGSSPMCNRDVDECQQPDPVCSKDPPVACFNSPGGFSCGGCPAGYTGNGFYCSDINECLVNNGGCSQNPRVECVNSAVSHGSRSLFLLPLPWHFAVAF